MKESDVSNLVRIKASSAGWRLWRNNVGAGKLENGSFIRWGLSNDSKAMNEHIKSGDLIGIRPVLITQDMVGKTIGQFVSREIKHSGWAKGGHSREEAQQNWIDLIRSLGGDAAFTTGEL